MPVIQAAIWQRSAKETELAPAEEQREGEHQTEGAGLAVPGDVDASGTERGERQGRRGHHDLADQHGQTEPQRERHRR